MKEIEKRVVPLLFFQQNSNKIRQNPNQNRLTSLNLRNQNTRHDDPMAETTKRSRPNQRTKQNTAKEIENESPLLFSKTLNKN
jgi:hypothetical protein